MSNIDIIRAWKDEEYRESLSAEQKAQLPANPAGLIELTDEDMSSMSGGMAAASHPECHTETCHMCCEASASVELA